MKPCHMLDKLKLWHFVCLILLCLPGTLVIAQQNNQQNLEFWEELAFWETIKDSKNPEEYEAYLLIYPDGRFAPLAKVRIKALQQQPATEEPPTRPKPTGTGDTFRDCERCPLMVTIAPGEFAMGSDQHRREEKPVHQVSISSPFALGVYEVSVGEWQACVDADSCRYRPDTSDPNLPVSNLSWDDAQAYVRWLSNATGSDYRLPSEAEWEYATRAGTETVYWWGDEAGQNRANCKDCGSQWSGKGPAPVGSFEPNPFGLYDVHGNLWEWAADCWNNNYRNAPTDGSAWLRGDCIARVLRSGAWQLDADYMRSARRSKYDRDVRYYLNGLRVAKSLP